MGNAQTANAVSQAGMGHLGSRGIIGSLGSRGIIGNLGNWSGRRSALAVWVVWAMLKQTAQIANDLMRRAEPKCAAHGSLVI